ncbi:MAG: hypothetical protein KatS3mg002_0176 [Candidatus Woesearchaeota archaeon]|nr:MAG: hypothetical protein KatS3mg002_0176 [Candidatus Woesearchaeota archaeon]
MQEFNPQNQIENQLFNQEQVQQQSQNNTSSKQNVEIEQIANIITDLDRRLRILEERYNNIRKKIQLTDQNILETERGFVKELKILNEDNLKLKKDVSDYFEKISIFNDEISQAAKKTDIMVIEKYLDLWDPKNFVTRKELREYLKEKIRLEKSDSTSEKEDTGLKKEINEEDESEEYQD